MRQLNFLLIFSFSLAAVTFILENTEPITVHFLPGMATTLPLAVLLLLAQQVRIQELENDLQRYRATVDAQLALLPTAGGSSAPTAAPAATVPVD